MLALRIRAISATVFYQMRGVRKIELLTKRISDI